MFGAFASRLKLDQEELDQFLLFVSTKNINSLAELNEQIEDCNEQELKALPKIRSVLNPPLPETLSVSEKTNHFFATKNCTSVQQILFWVMENESVVRTSSEIPLTDKIHLFSLLKYPKAENTIPKSAFKVNMNDKVVMHAEAIQSRPLHILPFGILLDGTSYKQGEQNAMTKEHCAIYKPNNMNDVKRIVDFYSKNQLLEEPCVIKILGSSENMIVVEQIQHCLKELVKLIKNEEELTQLLFAMIDCISKLHARQVTHGQLKASSFFGELQAVKVELFSAVHANNSDSLENRFNLDISAFHTIMNQVIAFVKNSKIQLQVNFNAVIQDKAQQEFSKNLKKPSSPKQHKQKLAFMRKYKPILLQNQQIWQQKPKVVAEQQIKM